MKKILLLILCIFIITGCRVEYKLVINNDLTIQESVKMTGTDEFFGNYYKSSRMNVIKTMLDENRRNTLIKNNYNYQIIEASTPYVLATKNYQNGQDFASNTIFFAQYFDEINCNEQDGVVTIDTKGFIPINPDYIERYNIKTTTIEITSSYKIVSNNATSVNKKTNTYTWYIDDETTDFSLEFAYDTNQIYKVPKDNTNLIMILVTIIIIILVIGVVYFRKNRDLK